MASPGRRARLKSLLKVDSLAEPDARRRLFIRGAAFGALPVLGTYALGEFMDGAPWVGTFMALCGLLMLANAWLARKPFFGLASPRITLLLCCAIIVVELFHHDNPTSLLFSATIPLAAIFVFGRYEGLVWAGFNWAATVLILLNSPRLGLPGLSSSLVDFNLSYAVVLLLAFGYEALQSRAVAALHAEQERLRDFARIASDWLFELDRDLKFTDVSEEWSRSLALSAEQLIGSPLTAVRRSLVADEDMDIDALTATLMERKPFYDVRFSVRIHDKVHHLTASGQPLFDADGNFSGYRGTARDVTSEAANRALIREKDAELLQAQKMEAIGQLTSGVAHDFNNLLTVINGNLELMKFTMEHDGPGKTTDLGKLDAAMLAAERAAELTSKLLSFARRQPLKPETLKIDELLEELEDLLRRTLGEQITIEFVAEPALWPCHVDAGLLESAILNLAINARDAMPGGGTLTIRCENQTLETGTEHLAAGDYVQIAVADTGTGIAPEVLPHVFEPFFTTKPTGEGSGLGLSMVYGFANQSGGRASITSTLGEGTTVTISLPRHDGAAQTAETPGATPLKLGRRRILVVEDEGDVRELVSSMAETLGHEVRSAPGIGDAMPLLTDWQPEILISDVILRSGNTGPDLAVRAKSLDPDIRVLLISGYPELALEGNGDAAPSWHLLKKPFGREHLKQALQQLYA